VYFPNVAIALRIYLTLHINNGKCERSFSTLARGKNHLRNTIGQERLAALILLCIESDVVRELDCTEQIGDQFKRQRRDLQRLRLSHAL